MERTPAEQAQFAVTDLLAVIARAAEDLNAFHGVLSRAPADSLAPFPKATVIVAVRVVDHLRAVEEGLRDIMTGLGLPNRPENAAAQRDM